MYEKNSYIRVSCNAPGAGDSGRKKTHLKWEKSTNPVNHYFGIFHKYIVVNDTSHDKIIFVIENANKYAAGVYSCSRYVKGCSEDTRTIRNVTLVYKGRSYLTLDHFQRLCAG